MKEEKYFVSVVSKKNNIFAKNLWIEKTLKYYLSKSLGLIAFMMSNGKLFNVFSMENVY